MEGKRRIGSVWSRRKKRERIARAARADRSMEAKFSRRLHRLRIDGRPGQLRTIPIALSILSNGVRKLAFHLFDLARWQLLVVGKEEEEKKTSNTKLYFFLPASSRDSPLRLTSNHQSLFLFGLAHFRIFEIRRFFADGSNEARNQFEKLRRAVQSDS